MKRTCSVTVLDESYPGIYFDKEGVCNHVHDFRRHIEPRLLDQRKNARLCEDLERIKKKNRNNEYDCIVGLSGGLDSSFMLHRLVTEYQMRPLVFHVDAGWNSDLAVHNIKVLLDGLGLDLMTEVINWQDMRDFQVAWFKAGVPHLDIPQDHAFVTTLYRFCRKYKISTIMNGGNISTESVLRPLKYIYWGSDLRHIKDIMNRFLSSPLRSYRFSSAFSNKVTMPYVYGVKVLKPLNGMEYLKASAIEELERLYGWRSYPEKHYESRFTKFFEGYWLYKRFGFDMRRVDYSSLILSGQMNREEALFRLETDPFSKDEVTREFSFIADKLEISEQELISFFEMPKKYYYDYKNLNQFFNFGESIFSTLGLTRRGGAF